MTWAAAGALALGALYTLSPLTIVAAVGAALILPPFGRGLPGDERRWLTAIVAVALVARLVAIGAIFVRNLPYHDDQFVGATTGDEAYGMGRALRARHVLTGSTTDAYDYFVTSDEYGRNSYIAALTRLQVVFGRAPYGVRLLNALLFTTGALLLYRVCRAAFGSLAAFGGLLVVLFWPTLFLWSISLLKESVYFLAASAALAATVTAIRTRRWRDRVLCAAIVALGLWIAGDLRPGAGVLLTFGLVLGAAAAIATASMRRVAMLGAAAIVAVAVAFSSTAVRQRSVRGLESAAKTHTGHVFTVGHDYKLLDAGFYLNPSAPASSMLTLTAGQAARFVVRAGADFLVVPLPWQLQSRRELAYLPEQVAWYVLVALLPVGIAFGLAADRIVTCLLAGYAAPTAAALALTSGNVGTLLRLRGLVIPLLAWIAVAGFCAMLGTAGQGKRFRVVDDRGRLFGRVNLFDAAVGAFLLALIPLAYGTYLLFRSPAMRISSVTRVPITREERRIAGVRLTAKLKVRGTALRPMLRASMDDTPALGFVFEDPNSADVLVGDVPPGTHDLILYDGVQEVARLPKAVAIEATAAPKIAAVGTLTNVDPAVAARLTPGRPIAGSSGAEILALGPDVASATGRQQVAELLLLCDPDPNADGCAIGGIAVNATPLPTVKVPSPDGSLLAFALSEIFPAGPATPATARVRFEMPDEVLALVHSGDRDSTIDDRAAVVASTGGARRSADRVAVDTVLRLGVDPSPDGWRYRGSPLKAGAPFRLSTDRYVIDGTVLSVNVAVGR